MNETDDNTGGWNSMSLRAKLQKDGEIYNKFSKSLTDNIKVVEKRNYAGGGAKYSVAGTSTNDAFWLLSVQEIVSGSGSSAAACEGTIYKLASDKGLTWNSYYSDYFRLRCRGGYYAQPGGTSFSSIQTWWMRTPSIWNSTSTTMCYDYRVSTTAYGGTKYAGIAPCFCF